MKRRLFVTTKLMSNLTKFVTSESFHINFFLAVNFSFLITVTYSLDKLRILCYKFLHILQLSQSCEQEDFNNTIEFYI